MENRDVENRDVNQFSPESAPKALSLSFPISKPNPSVRATQFNPPPCRSPGLQKHKARRWMAVFIPFLPDSPNSPALSCTAPPPVLPFSPRAKQLSPSATVYHAPTRRDLTTEPTRTTPQDARVFSGPVIHRPAPLNPPNRNSSGESHPPQKTSALPQRKSAGFSHRRSGWKQVCPLRYSMNSISCLRRLGWRSLFKAFVSI